MAFQLAKPVNGGTITQEFGPPAPVVAAREPLGYVGRDAHGFLNRAVTNFAGATYYDHFHDALDWAAPMGTPMYAPADGKVVRVATYTDGNRYLAIEVAPGVACWYWHCLDWASSVVGKLVKRGDVVAHMGSTGNSTGSHVHFEVRVQLAGKVYWYNPARLLDGADLAISDDGYIVAATGGGDMNCIVTQTALPAPRALTFNVAAAGFDPARPNTVVAQYLAGTAGTATHVPVALLWQNGRPNYPDDDNKGAFLRLTDGNLVLSASVTLAPAPPAGDTTAAYNAGVDAASAKAKEARK